MKITVLDGFTENPGDLSWAALEKFGDFTVYDRTPRTPSEIIRRIGDAEIVITNKCPITREILDACPKIKYISVLATGYNVVDVQYAAEKGIPVSNVPTYGTEAVHAGRWESAPDWTFWDYPLIELAGKTMGIIGFGKIGQTTGRIAKAMGMRILATGSRETEAGRAIASYTDLDTLLRESDVIALHCPLFPSTEGIINRDTIAKMKDGVILINNSRGPLIVEQDLADALNSGKVYAAGLDVVSTEPIRSDNPLLRAKNCFITPHISWAPREARARILDISAQNLEAFLNGAPINVVNAK